MCSVFIVVQFRSCGELLCVTNVHVIMSADKCKLCNVCFFLGGRRVAQLVESLSYKLEGHGFDSLQCHWNFLLT